MTRDEASRFMDWLGKKWPGRHDAGVWWNAVLEHVAADEVRAVLDGFSECPRPSELSAAVRELRVSALIDAEPSDGEALPEGLSGPALARFMLNKAKAAS